MTLDEAKKLADIVATADSGCSVCVGDLVAQLNAVFPQFEFKLTEERVKIPDPCEPSPEPDDWVSSYERVDVVERVQ